MRKFKNLFKVGTLAGLMAFLPSCERDPSEKDDSYRLPKFERVYESLVQDKLEFPSGLSNNSATRKSELKSRKGISADADGIFIQAPLFINHHGSRGIEPYQNPIISEYTGTLENLSTNPLAEINLSDYFSDFDSPTFYPLEDSLWRARGTTLDGLVLSDGTILASSNSSDKLFKRNPSGEIEIFLQNKDLERITDMVQGSDGKIYAVQAPLVDYDDASKVLFPKRVVSVNKDVINTEFELPSDIISHSWEGPFPQHYPYWWRDAPLLEKLKIVENSENGKKQFGAEFYISDLFEGKIYKVDASNKIEILAKDLQFPSSLAVDSIGNIFYTTTPFQGKEMIWDALTYKFSLNILNPETGVSEILHEFDETLRDYSDAGIWAYVNYNKEFYRIPVGYNISNVLYESKDKLEFLITNSLRGTLKYVSLDKILEK